MSHQRIANNVSRETLTRLEIYVETLLKWQKKINLISNNTISTIWQRHIEDAIQLTQYITDKHGTIMDIGTGAGIPGLILSMCGYPNLILVESDTRKCAFLREASQLCKVTPKIINKRIETIENQKVDVLLSRACAPINTLITYGHRFLKNNSVCLFPKGENYIKEIEEAKKFWDFDFEVFQICLNLLHYRK